ncbi:MAG TPA: hypothetical protein VMT35_04135 [Ignavibacteriaceae bacterium]|nr:hypothetical protein [Ignavibacteriaceae bacterium]
MKKYIYLLALLSFIIIGCSDHSNVVAPVGTNDNEPNWIAAANTLEPLKKDITVNKTIYGDQESLLEINTGYPGGIGWISITANAKFQRYSFTGSLNATMTINDQFGTADFTPSETFSKPVIYNLTIVGLDLRNVDPSKVRFVYMAPDGNYYQPQYDRLYVEIQSGKLQIINALLPHFSRYGFVN